MKRRIAYALVLALCLSMATVPASAETWWCPGCGKANDLYFCSYCGSAKITAPADCWSLAIDRISTRSGPSPRYTDMGTYSLKGQYLRVVAKAWDNVNRIWWVKVDVPNAGLLWTGAKRFDSATLQLNVLAEEVWPYDPSGSVNGSGSSTNGGSSSSGPYGWLIGRWGKVCVNEGHARTGPGTNYSKAGVVYYGEWYEILDVTRGDTAKDWCKVCLGTGEIVWISTGLMEIDGRDGGTINGVWAP